MDGRLIAWGTAIVFVLAVAAGVAVVAIMRRRARELTREEILRDARRAGRQMAKKRRTAGRGSIRGKGSGNLGGDVYGSAGDSGGAP